jgi:hypothetical protein
MLATCSDCKPILPTEQLFEFYNLVKEDKYEKKEPHYKMRFFSM